MPVAAVGVCDESQFIDARDEGAEEEEVDEGDENRGALRGGVTDHRVKAPEDGDHTDDEEDEDIHWGDLVGFEEAVDEVSLRRVSILFGIWQGLRWGDVPAFQ